jgi:hypothetical protein
VNTIDALKRLERAGSENSRTTEKLKEAAGLTLDCLNELGIPADKLLPRGYTLNTLDECTRTGAMRVASLVATGWLDELALWMEKENSTTTEAVETLRRAAEAMEAVS